MRPTNRDRRLSPLDPQPNKSSHRKSVGVASDPSHKLGSGPARLPPTTPDCHHSSYRPQITNLPSPPNTNTNSSDAGSGSVGDSVSKRNCLSTARSLPRRNRVGLLTRTPNQSQSQSHLHHQSSLTPSDLNNNPPTALRPSPAPRPHLSNGRPPKSALRQLRSVSSLANLRLQPHHPQSPPWKSRVSTESTHSSVRRSMDHSTAEHKTRPPLSFTQAASLPRNSKSSSIKRISSAWKPQGTPTQKNVPRHSLDITPTKTVVPPALVTDVPLLKRTSTTDLSQLHRQASTSSVSLSSFHKINVRPNRTGSNGSLDPKGSKVRVRDRSKELNLAKIEEPASLTRSKKLMSMKEKNERILANINATISPPNSPTKSYRAPSSEPPLPPPPPSSDSSSASSSTSSDTDADSLAFKTVLSPAAPPHPTPHSERVHHSASDSLRIPNQSGLIPFAQGLSPSPRKIPSSSSSNFKPDGKSPKMEEDGRDEDLRLGSVRGKRADQRRSIIGFGLDEDEEGDGNEEEVCKAVKTSAGKHGRQEDGDRTLTYKAEDTEKEQQGSMRRITARKDAQASNQLSSGSKQDAQESSRGKTEARRTDSQLLSSSGLRDRDEQSEPVDIPDRIRHPSESMSLTSSSETIGKGMTTGSQGSFTPPSRHDSYCHSDYDFQADEDEGWNVGRRLRPSEAEEDNMLTPVKKARGPGMLRHSSSVDDVAGHHHHHHDERPRSVLAPASSTFSRGSARNGRTSAHQLSSSHDLRASQSVLRGLLPSPSRPAHAQGTRPGRASSLAFEPDYRHPPDFHPTSNSSHHRLLHQPTDEWDARDARQNSIFPTTTANTTTQHQQELPAMNGSPPQSHLNHSRRSRPGLPQHFIQPSRTSESSTSYRSPILSGFSNARTPDRSLRTSPVRSQTLAHAQPSPSRYGRGSDSVGRGIESAMSFYDPAVGQSSGALSAFRSKHSSLTTADDYSAFERSHSVFGGVYDPRNLTTGRLGRSRRTGSDEEGPQSLNMSQQHSVVGSGSDSRWTRNASDGQRRSTGTPSSNVQRERDRTVRGSGGGGRASHLVRASQDSSTGTRNGAIGDQQSSSSGGSSSRPHYPNSSGRPIQAPSRLTHSRPPTRAESSQSGAGQAGLGLSPTPEIEHHKLLLGALEALEASEDEPELVSLVSTLVKHTCRLNAALQTLLESGLAAQVELALVDGPERLEILETEHTETERAHAVLARVSNNQIRSLTESLLCVQNRLRTRQRAEAGASRDSLGDLGPSTRSFSRASGHYSRSASPAKLSRTFAGISPLSRIVGVDEEDDLDSPLARVSKRAGLEVGAGAGFTRASTITFAQDRHSARAASVQQRLRASNRLSGSSTSMATARRREAPEAVDEFGSYRASLDSSASSSRRSRAWENEGLSMRGSQSMMVFPNRLSTNVVSELNAHSHNSPTRPDPGGSISSMSQILDRAQSMLGRKSSTRARFHSDASVEALRTVMRQDDQRSGGVGVNASRSSVNLGRSSTVVGRSSTVVGRSSTNLRRSSTIVGRSSTVGGRSSVNLGRSSANVDRFENEGEEEEEEAEESRTPMKHDHRRQAEEGEQQSQQDGGRRRRKMSALTGASAALERLSQFGGMRSWAGAAGGGRRILSPSGSGSGPDPGPSRIAGRLGEQRPREAEEAEDDSIVSEGMGMGRRRGGSIQQLLKMKRTSMIRN